MEDDSAGDTGDLLGLSDFSHSSREAKESAALLQQPIWRPSRKSSPHSGRGKEKLYQGRTTAQQQNKAASVSPPLDQKPKLKIKSPRSQREAESKRPKRLSKSNSSDPEPSHHRQPQTELKRPKRLSQSNISHRRRSMSSGSVSSDDLREALNDGPYVKQPLRRRSRSASPSFKRPSLQRRPSSVQRRPSLQAHQRRPSLERRPSFQRRPSSVHRRPSLQKRPSTQSIQSNRPPLLRRSSNVETSSRRILAGSFQDNDAILSRRSSFTTIETLHVPLKDEPRPGRERSRNEDGHVRRRSRSLDAKRRRSRKNEDSYIRRRSRSLDGRFQTDDKPFVPLNDKPRNRRRSISYDSAASENSNPTDFKEELEKRRASKKKEVETRDSAEVKKDLEKRKASIKGGVEERTRRRIPAVRTTKKVEDENQKEKRKQRHQMAITKKKEENPSEEFEAGESTPRRRSSRRPRASGGYSRLHSSFNKSWSKALNRKRKPPPAPAAEALYAPPAAALASLSPREANAENDVERNDVESSRRKKKRGCYVSRFMMTVMCFCYLFSLIGVFAVGFWTHMEFFAYKDTKTTVNQNTGFRQDSYENSTSMLRPSSSSSAFNPSGSADVNLQPFPTDGGMGTKVSQIPAVASNNPSSNPTPIVSGVPSLTPTLSPYPTTTPSISPSNVSSESPSSEPTVTRSESPSQSPTILEECPETLSRSMPFISDTDLTLYYETVIYRDHPTGGLLCASLEYSGSAGWIGIAFSTAGRNPQFGRREAIIGMPGVESAVAVSAQNVTSSALNPSGNQNNFEGGPSFVNPGKYDIRAGGLDGYYGPSLNFLMSDNQQTLLNASVTTSDESNQTVTRLSFVKYLREPGEIEIKPLGGPTLILYAVAPIDPSSGLYINENPQWKYINMILGDGRSNTRSSFVRKRQHKTFSD